MFIEYMRMRVPSASVLYLPLSSVTGEETQSDLQKSPPRGRGFIDHVLGDEKVHDRILVIDFGEKGRGLAIAKLYIEDYYNNAMHQHKEVSMLSLTAS